MKKILLTLSCLLVAVSMSASAPGTTIRRFTAPKTLAAETEEPVDVAGWLSLLAILPILSAITGKMVTEKCLKHGEVIKKIRV